MTHPRRRVVVVAALVAALAVLGVNPAPVTAAVCTWSACNGRDPSATGCDADAYTLAEFRSENDGYMRVELRYSPRCHAAWARSTVGSPGMPPHPWLVLYAYASSTGGNAHTSYWKKVTNSTNDTGPSGRRKWSYMHTYASWVQACIKNSNEEGPCTARR